MLEDERRVKMHAIADSICPFQSISTQEVIAGYIHNMNESFDKGILPPPSRYNPSVKTNPSDFSLA